MKSINIPRFNIATIRHIYIKVTQDCDNTGLTERVALHIVSRDLAKYLFLIICNDPFLLLTMHSIRGDCVRSVPYFISIRL